MTSDTLKRVLLPALAGAAGTGALSGYVSSQTEDPDETPGERRRRIIRNSLLGAGVGGLAGAAVPAGWEALNTRLGPPPSTDIGSGIAHTIARHPVIAGGLAAGGVGLLRGGSKTSPAVLAEIQNVLKRTAKGTGGSAGAAKALGKETPDALLAAMRSPKQYNLLRGILSSHYGARNAPATARTMSGELLQRFGADKGPRVAELAEHLRLHGNPVEKFVATHLFKPGDPVMGQKALNWMARRYSSSMSPSLTGTLRPGNVVARMAKSPLGYAAGGAAAGYGADKALGATVPGWDND